MVEVKNQHKRHSTVKEIFSNNLEVSLYVGTPLDVDQEKSVEWFWNDLCNHLMTIAADSEFGYGGAETFITTFNKTLRNGIHISMTISHPIDVDFHDFNDEEEDRSKVAIDSSWDRWMGKLGHEGKKCLYPTRCTWRVDRCDRSKRFPGSLHCDKCETGIYHWSHRRLNVEEAAKVCEEAEKEVLKKRIGPSCGWGRIFSEKCEKCG